MAGASGLPLAGVEAIVEGLAGFQSDIRSMNSALDSIRPRATLLQNVFSSAWETVKDFGREVLNVAEYALGHLLSDALEFAVQKIGELISATIDAGSEFQTLELRLERLNFNSLIESGMDATAAGGEALKMTKEQLEWLQKLAAKTPYDNTDISKTYTLARSYGFVDKEARNLTEDIVNFASGMGLGNTEIERIIINFGQMVQQGKVTQREMNDLARGSFVPVNDILKRMQQNLGMSTSELQDFRQTAASVPEFMKAFSQVVEQRFTGAAEKMAKTFKAASDNALDIVKSIGGLNIVKPVLDAVGERIAAFTAAFTDNPQRWDRMVNAAKRVGDALAGVVRGVFDLLPSSESLADSVVSVVEKVASWIEKHRGDIINFFKGIGDTIRNDIIPWIQDHLVPMFERLSAWVKENGPTIQKFFKTVGEIVSEFFSDLTGGREGKNKGGDILDSITRFMQFVIENKEKIVKWVEVLWSVFAVWQVLSTLWNIAIGVIISLGGFLLGLIGIFSAFAAILAAPVLGPIAAVIAALGLVVVAVVAVFVAIRNNFMGARDAAVNLLGSMISAFYGIINGAGQLLGSIIGTFTNIRNFILGLDWGGVGRTVVSLLISGMGGAVGSLISMGFTLGQSAMSGIVQGVQNGIGAVQTAIENARMQIAFLGQSVSQGLAAGIAAYTPAPVKAITTTVAKVTTAASRKLKVRSPSKVFEGLGVFTMEGFAQGIEKAAGVAVGAMQGAMSAVAMPAVSSMALARASGDTYNNTRNMNLTVNTSAPVEPILQDFEMLSSLGGA